MLQQVCVFKLNVRLYKSDGTNYIEQFIVKANDYINAHTVLEKYLTENKKDTNLIYDKIDCITNVDSEYVVMDI